MGYCNVGEILGDPVQKQPAASVSGTTKRKRFSDAQNSLIMAEFAELIERKELPTKPATEAFLERHGEDFSDRKPHDIYDRLRNIIGRKNIKH